MLSSRSASNPALPASRRRGAHPARPSRRAWPLVSLLALVGLLALAGVYLSLGVLAREEQAATLDPSTVVATPVHGQYAVGDTIPTSFGLLTISEVKKLNGLTASALAGVTHGIGSLLRPDQVMVQVSFQLTNLSAQPRPYSTKPFRLIVQKTHQTLPVFSATFSHGTLQPHSSVDGTAGFGAPRNGSRLILQFHDPGAAKPIVIDLGRIGTTPKNAFDGYHHH